MKFDKKLIWYSLPILVGVFLIYKQFRKPKTSAIAPPPPPFSPVGSGTSTGGSTGSSRANDNFPLKRGSKGENVRKLQQSMLKIDPNILPRFGADGDFGGETEAAVQKLIFKNEVSYSDSLLIYNRAFFPMVTPKLPSETGGLGGIPPFIRGY